MRRNRFGQPVGHPIEWTGAPRAESIVLTGHDVELQPLAAAHAGDLAELREHPELWTYLPDEVPADHEAAESQVGVMIDDPDLCGFAIVDPATGKALGRMALIRIQPTLGIVEVGHVLYGPDLQRTRGATEAQYLLMRHVFADLGYRRYEWKCDSLNQPSREAALRLGFTEEGTWRNALVSKGRNRDTTWFSITNDEWPSRQTAFEAWLDDANFVDGRQVRSLADLRVTPERD